MNQQLKSEVASEPTGTETVKVFAFTQKPGFYDALVQPPSLNTSQLQNLIQTLIRDSASLDRSQTQRMTFTAPARH